MVAHPGDYTWSSWRAHVGEHADPMLTPHAQYLALGADGASRAKAYRSLFDEALPAELVDEIHRYLVQERALSSDRCRAWVEARTGRFSTVRSAGRPTRASNRP